MRKEASGAGEKAVGRGLARLARVGLVAALAIATSVTLPGQQPDPAQAQTPTFRAGVNAVQVDAFVTVAKVVMGCGWPSR